MDEFLKVLIEIGVFLIIGQTILHFRPRKEYEKYMKTIISLMVLSQLVVPIFSLFNKDYEIKIQEALAKYQIELERFEEKQLSVQLQGNKEADRELEAFEAQLKNEINETLGEQSFDVRDVNIISEGEGQKIELYLKEKGEITIETIAVGGQVDTKDTVEKQQIEELEEEVAKAVGVEPEYIQIYLE